MKKILSVVAVFALLVAGAISAKAAVDLGNGYSLNGTGNISFYGATYTPAERDSSSANGESYRFELYLNRAFDNGGRAVLRFRGGDASDGSSAPTYLGLGNFRPGINDQRADGWGNQFRIRELYYQQPLFEKVVYFKIGKMQPSTSGNNGGNSVGSFFTDDATIQNVDGTLGSYGVEVGVSPISILTISYSFLGQQKYQLRETNPVDSSVSDGLFSHGYHTFLLTATPIEKGNYRVGYWYSDIKRDLADQDTDYDPLEDATGTNGVFVSIDQIVADYFQLFGRLGLRTDKAETANVDGQAGGMSWQVGATILGGLWSRDADAFFLGVGGAAYQDKEYLDASEKNPSMELHIEANYSFSLASGISLIPFFQYVSNIMDGTDDNGDWEYASGLAFGLRTQIKF